ncbi:(2Fe-2S)-binding protein [Alkaliphilus hydrothermalis]|uniref:Bacterioferritin-associated ferredoxin n=1 Tax=Alkaliphilus hydrothermalis TaxID=1482730 RepID=A0ABS2NLC2_9FIRM|nr:(2Fe-2S)-binding protein [Alkaliphilus hydrothermalis]MBM7613745.1 bacterioferritin-associated ferredoxin [Alkaliphilus hydrothermalis]
MENITFICRCSDLTLQDIRDLINKGYNTFDELKRISRVGMGPCQGRTCLPLVLRELSIATGKPISELCPGTFRPPIKSIKLGAIADHTLEEGGEVNHV